MRAYFWRVSFGRANSKEIFKSLSGNVKEDSNCNEVLNGIIDRTRTKY